MKDLIITVFVGVLIFFGVKSCSESDWHQQNLQEEADRKKREQTPHVIREADGCKVYTFLSGDRYHYFTRCPESRTTADSSWDECRTSGKHTTCNTRTETIEVSR